MRNFIIFTPRQVQYAVINSRGIIWVGHTVSIEEIRNAYKILVGILEGKRSLRKHGKS
jgi:hypothetical protein